MSGISSISGFIGTQGMQQAQQRMFSGLDSDSSGGISQSELETLAEKIKEKTGASVDTSDAVSTYDTDGSGELSIEELQAFLDASGIQPPRPYAAQGMGKGPEGLFSEIDTDGSGGISQTELETLAEKIEEETGTAIDTEEALSTYDTDGDGELSSEELQSFLDDSGIKPPPPPEVSMEDTGSQISASSLKMEQALSLYGVNKEGGQGSLSFTA